MTEKTAKPAPRKRTTSPRAKKERKPDQTQIAERAYFIHLKEGSRDELANWLRAERELTAA
jgi:Protein of unknown function (DUF2934)